MTQITIILAQASAGLQTSLITLAGVVLAALISYLAGERNRKAITNVETSKADVLKFGSLQDEVSRLEKALDAEHDRNDLLQARIETSLEREDTLSKKVDDQAWEIRGLKRQVDTLTRQLEAQK